MRWSAALTGKLERAKTLDPAIDAIDTVVTRALPPGGVKDLLHGRWLGHPLHPLLVALPIGMSIGVLAFDLFGGERGRDAARKLLGLTLVAIPPTALSGVADWSALGKHRRPRRVGLVHALSNSTASAMFLASWLARRRGGSGRGWAMAGALALSIGGYLGGHLSYAQGVGVNRTIDRQIQPREWTDVAAASDIVEGEMHLTFLGDQPVLLTRLGAEVYAMSATCSHYGGPLYAGRIESSPEPCVVCPWHGSRFRLSDGEVLRGPATTPELVYECRVEGDRVQIRIPAAISTDPPPPVPTGRPTAEVHTGAWS